MSAESFPVTETEMEHTTLSTKATALHDTDQASPIAKEGTLPTTNAESIVSPISNNVETADTVQEVREPSPGFHYVLDNLDYETRVRDMTIDHQNQSNHYTQVYYTNECVVHLKVLLQLF